jgi:hypothetical protein
MQPTFTPTYLDTSALMRRAEGLLPSPNARTALIKPYIDGILSDPGRVLACSDLTIIEYHSTLTTYLRASDKPDCDFSWWAAARLDLLSSIGSGRISVLPTPPKAYEQVMSLVTTATLQHQKALKAWDALHVTIAAKWSFELGHAVDFVTADTDFRLVIDFSGLAPHLSIVNLDVQAGTGVGADRRNS